MPFSDREVEWLAAALKTRVLGWLPNATSGSGGETLDLAPYLRADGARALIGNLPVNDGVQLDGVDLSQHAANPAAHHEPFTGLRDMIGQAVTPDGADQIRLQSRAGIRIERTGWNELSIDLNAPGQISAQSAATPYGNHTHDVAASAAPGAAEWLLKSNAVGGLDLAGRFSVGTNVFVADVASGRVGIGTAAPQAELDVLASAIGVAGLQVNALGVQSVAPVQLNAPNAAAGVPTVRLTAPQSTGYADGMAFAARGPADAADRLLLYSDGKIGLGNGQGLRDVFYSRHAAGQGKLTSDGLTGAADWLVGGRGMFGQIATPGAQLEARSGAGAQLRLSYDTANYADLTTGGGGNLTIAPSGDLILDPAGKDVLPARSYDINLGSQQKKLLSLWAAELRVETLVADQTLATIGGRILVGPTTQLVLDRSAPLAVPAPTVTAMGGTGSTTYTYYVSAFDADGYETNNVAASIASRPATLTGSAFNRISWPAVFGAVRYNIYMATGLLATVTSLTYYDHTGAATTTGTGVGSNETGRVFAVKYNNLAAGDIVYMEAGGKVEFMQVLGALENYARNASFELWASGSPQQWTAANSAALAQAQPATRPHGSYVLQIS